MRKEGEKCLFAGRPKIPQHKCDAGLTCRRARTTYPSRWSIRMGSCKKCTECTTRLEEEGEICIVSAPNCKEGLKCIEEKSGSWGVCKKISGYKNE